MLEVELKLDVTPDAASLIASSAVLPADPQHKDLRATYFDTPAGDLAAAGFSLRIRTAGEERVQTIKADGATNAGLFMRSEWEMPAAGDTPVLDHTTPLKALLGERAADLGAVFEVHVERTIWNVAEGEAQIEAVLDRGQVLAHGRGELICEFELELKSGPPAALFTLARKLDDIAPVRIGVLSKSERGYGLVAPSGKSVKGAPVTLKPEMDAATAFQHIAHACLRQFRQNEALLMEHRRAKALHQARVALRRLRSAFSLFKPLFGEDAKAAALREELRWLAGSLGEARNLDVLIDRAPAGALKARLEHARAEAYDRVEAALASPRARALMLDLMEWLADGAWLADADTAPSKSEPVREYAMRTLHRARRRVKKGGPNLAKVDDDARHELRKDAKKLRYASEFFAALFDAKRGRRRHKRFIAALTDLQDQLGLLNDLATAPEEVAKLDLADDAEAQALLGSESKPHLIDAAAKAYDRLVDTKRFWRKGHVV